MGNQWRERAENQPCAQSPQKLKTAVIAKSFIIDAHFYADCGTPQVNHPHIRQYLPNIAAAFNVIPQILVFPCENWRRLKRKHQTSPDQHVSNVRIRVNIMQMIEC